jgi:aryl-alcohol dehydrogenase-like predicted oxidoreductase
MDRAHEHGINFFDTADVYGWKKGEGITEQIIGRWFAQGDNRREKTVLATKLYGEMGDWPNQSRVSALNIKRACEAHCAACKPTTSICIRCTTSTALRRGKNLAGDGSAGRSKAKCCTSVRRTSPAGTSRRPMKPPKHATSSGLVCEQSLYNLNARTVEMEVIPACEHYGLGLIPWSRSVAVCSVESSRKPKEGRRAGMDEQIEKNRDKLKAWEGLCKKLGEKPAMSRCRGCCTRRS